MRSIIFWTALISIALATRQVPAADAAKGNIKPVFLGNVVTVEYDATTDDLLTAGLGWEGLMMDTPPTFSNPLVPTCAELRKLAIYTNYRSLVDVSEDGGYGWLYGPNVSLTKCINKTPGAGKIAGVEYRSCSLDAVGRVAATLLVQIPANFDGSDPFIVTASSPGSRGIYGAIAPVGEWALKHRCAVAYTDKGTGNGAHDLFTNVVVRVDGVCADAASRDSLFTANLTGEERSAFNAAFPYRYAFKHAHSGQNPEKDWGQFTLQAVEFAMFALNDHLAPFEPGTNVKSRMFTRANTRVIAASISNGGGAALAAAEQDTKRLIDAVVVGEPQINLRLPKQLKVMRGGKLVVAFGKPLYDYITIANLFQPVAAYASACASSPALDLVDRAAAEKRARELADAKLITGKTFAEQADSALAALHDAGYESESNLLHASHFGVEATPGVAITFANAYSRARVTDNLCGFSFAACYATGVPRNAIPSPLLTLFGMGSGIPPTTNGIQLIYNDAVGGPIIDRAADGDFALLGAQRLRNLWTGTDAVAKAVRAGVDEVRVTGDLHARPVIIVHGRNDTVVPVNHSSRPYFGMNKIAEGQASQLSYIEVTNAHHFDGYLTPIATQSRWTFNQYLVPLHYYNLQALELMWEHLHFGKPLPRSQVVRTRARGLGAPRINVTTNLNPIVPVPAQKDAIYFDAASHTVHVPD